MLRQGILPFRIERSEETLVSRGGLGKMNKHEITEVLKRDDRTQIYA